MGKASAGILLYRRRGGMLEVFLVHPGGPFWARKDEGAWSIPKGEIASGEDALACAKREFREETGQGIEGEFRPLGEVRQAGGKLVTAWAVAGDLDAERIESNSFEMEWPPRSGRRQSFPEVDRAGWFSLAEARRRINKSQAAFLDRLAAELA
ncbi:MAG TPA: NUDIX domain-containing protein [Stellaceae bacterium]|nr:NUDIX domain-containing protein [Stellaceae bacterium]